MSYGSPQGIAKLYRGNPGMLDARIKQEQQAKPGMPPDLAKLLALQIDVNEQDAVKRQEAMAALQGMQQQAPMGKPPTVAESLQQLALQKARQVAVQQQQQQKGLQALLGQAAPTQAPERPPQPERQGSIEELQSNLGENYAGGGIVAFSGTGSSQFVKDISALPEAFDEMKQRAREEDARQAEQDRRMEQYRQAKLAAQQKTSLFNYLFGTPEAEKEGLAKLTELSNAPLSTPAAPTAAPAELDPETRKLAGLAASRAQTGQNVNPALQPAATAPATKQRQTTTSTTNVPAAPATEAVTPAQTAREKFLASQFEMTPAQRREEFLKRYAEQVGGPDTAAQEAYIKMLQGKVGGMDTEKDLYGRIGDYARKLALAGGRTSLQTGAAASGMIEAERLANEQKKMDLLKEIMGESTKVADVKRGYKKELFTGGEKEYDDAYKNAYDAVKESGLDERQKQLFAHQTAEKVLDRKNALAIANIRADATGGNTADKQQLAELKALQASKTSQLKNAYGSDKKRLQGELATIEAAIAKMAGLDTMAAAPGAAGPGGTRPPLSSFQR